MAGDGKWVLHEWLLAGWGCPIGELFDLEELSVRCRELGRWSFFLSSVPLKVCGKGEGRGKGKGEKRADEM